MIKKFSLVCLGLALGACASVTPPRAPLEPAGAQILAGGEPVLLLGDTFWSAAAKLSDAEMVAYLDDAKAIGFNVVGVFGVWALENGANAQGDAPFIDGDPAKLNPPYWERYRRFAQLAAARGIYIYFCIGEPISTGGENITRFPVQGPAHAYAYGRALGAFFRRENASIIWALGQDSSSEGSGHT